MDKTSTEPLLQENSVQEPYIQEPWPLPEPLQVPQQGDSQESILCNPSFECLTCLYCIFGCFGL